MRFATDGIFMFYRAAQSLTRAVRPDMCPAGAACAGRLLKEEVHHLIGGLGEELLARVHPAACYLVAISTLEGVRLVAGWAGAVGFLLLLHGLIPLLLGGAVPCLGADEGVDICWTAGLVGLGGLPTFGWLEQPRALGVNVIHSGGNELIERLVLGLGHVAFVTDPGHLSGGLFCLRT